jgi:hypothetical protein
MEPILGLATGEMCGLKHNSASRDTQSARCSLIFGKFNFTIVSWKREKKSQAF